MTRLERAVLYVDDAVPRAALGAGHPRGLAVVRALAAIAPRVAIVPTQGALGHDVPADALPANVDVLGEGPAERALARALAEPPGRYAVVWVGRPNNLAWLERIARAVPHAFEGVRIVYDAEAVFALRDARKRALEGAPMSEVRMRHALRQELYAAQVAHAIASVSEAEGETIAEVVGRPVTVLALPAAPRDPPTTPAGRAGALFVGSLSPADSPNGDGMRWLLRDAWARRAARSYDLVVAGRGGEAAGWLAPLATPSVRLLGPVADLGPLYAQARLFVAPTRYASGIPLKVIEAAQHGVPVVATRLIADLLRWRDGVELLAADDADGFAHAMDRLAQDDALWRRLVDGANAALARDFAPARFAQAVATLAGVPG